MWHPNKFQVKLLILSLTCAMRMECSTYVFIYIISVHYESTPVNSLVKGPSINDVSNWEGGEGSKIGQNLSKLPTDSTKNLPT